jgi:hypothetical protein
LLIAACHVGKDREAVIEAQYQETAVLPLGLDEVTRNLVENLHLRWGYGLLYVDKYSDEDDNPVNVVYGIRKKDDDAIYGMRLLLTDMGTTTELETNLWRVVNAGWPFTDSTGNSIFVTSRVKDEETMIELAEDIFRFCETPHGQATGVMDTLRSLFAPRDSKRKYNSVDS